MRWIFSQAGALAAGNAVVIKPSESSPACSALLAELIPKYLDNDLVRVVNGGILESTKLMELPWDHILYTGGGRVGKIIAAAAAKHMSPLSLELGGKSPVFIDPRGDLQLAANRILWGKLVNAGQTCIAPDYVLVPRSSQEAFVEALKVAYQKFYPDSPEAEGAFGRVVNDQAFDRISKLLEASKGTVVFGGDTDSATKYIAPTVHKDVQMDDALMQEEIFGPVLPIVPVDSLDEAISFVNAHDHPLALYVFSQDAKYKAKVFGSTQSGCAIANEVVFHAAAYGIPFGGIGPSGAGYHTGKYGFDMFTHSRGSMDTPGWLDKFLGLRYPPYTERNKKLIRFALFRRLPKRPVPRPQEAAGK